MGRRSVLPLVGLLAFAGCASTVPSHDAGFSASQANEQAAIDSALQQAQAQRHDYKIVPEDILELSVYQHPDFNLKPRVSQQGTISLPLIGTAKVAGLSATEAAEVLTRRLKEFLVNPQVTLSVKEYSAKKVVVLGEVNKPGSYPLPPESPLTVLEAISLAGGPTPIAAPNRTKVIRTVNGKSQTIQIEVSAITKRGERQKDISLEPNDVIYVPQSFF